MTWRDSARWSRASTFRWNNIVSIADHLIPKLIERFPDRGLKVMETTQPFAIFPAIHKDVGDIEIYDDGDELTLVAGKFTHGHFYNYDDNLTEDQKTAKIGEEVVEFLDAVFADRVVFWGSHSGAGGWDRRDVSTEDDSQSVWPIGGDDLLENRNEYVWSGPLGSPSRQNIVQRIANYLRGRLK